MKDSGLEGRNRMDLLEAHALGSETTGRGRSLDPNQHDLERQ